MQPILIRSNTQVFYLKNFLVFNYDMMYLARKTLGRYKVKKLISKESNPN